MEEREAKQHERKEKNKNKRRVKSSEGDETRIGSEVSAPGHATPRAPVPLPARLSCQSAEKMVAEVVRRTENTDLHSAVPSH